MNSSKIRLPHQSTANTIISTHPDIIHKISYDYHGQMLATISGNQIIKISKLLNKQWSEMQQIKHSQSDNGHTHKSQILNICWCHPLFGSLFAVHSKNEINIFELSLTANKPQKFEFVRKSQFTQALDIIHCQFTPHYLGLKLSIVCKDGIVKIMKPRNTNTLHSWILAHQIIVNQSVQTPFNALPFRPHITNPKNKNDSLTDIQLNKGTKIHCIAWNSNKYEFASFCVGANNNQIFIFGYISHSNNEYNKHWTQIQKIDINSENNNQSDIVSICWSNHIARKYHLIGCGCSDGFVRVIKIMNKSEGWKWSVIFEEKVCGFVREIKWNISGTSLVAIGRNGKVYLLNRDRVQNTYVLQCVSESECLERNVSDGSESKEAMFEDKKEREIEQKQPMFGGVNFGKNHNSNNNAFGGFGNDESDRVQPFSGFGSNANEDKSGNGFNFGSSFGSGNDSTESNNNNNVWPNMNANTNNDNGNGFGFGGFGNANNDNQSSVWNNTNDNQWKWGSADND